MCILIQLQAHVNIRDRYVTYSMLLALKGITLLCLSLGQRVDSEITDDLLRIWKLDTFFEFDLNSRSPSDILHTFYMKPRRTWTLD